MYILCIYVYNNIRFISYEIDNFLVTIIKITKNYMKIIIYIYTGLNKMIIIFIYICAY